MNNATRDFSGAKISESVDMIDVEGSPMVQDLSKFALSESLRQRVGNTLRKRSRPADREEKNNVEELSTNSVGVVKVQSRRVKQSDRVTGTRDQSKMDGSPSALEENSLGNYNSLDPSFYECDALELAPKLLGKLIRRGDVILQITEVEAYRPGDSACHGRAGRTARTAPLFGPAGHAYVYLCYGMHVMLNVVADRVGLGAAVLVRSCSPVSGLKTIQIRRGQATEKPVLLTGPGKVGQALGLTTEWSTHPLFTPGGLQILDAPAATSVLVGPRVGIDYADPKDVAALWRFAMGDTAWISAPRSTLRPQQNS